MDTKNPIKDIKDVEDLQVFYLVRKTGYDFGSINHLMRLSVLFDDSFSILVSANDYNVYFGRSYMQKCFDNIKGSMGAETDTSKSIMGENCPVVAVDKINKSFAELQPKIFHYLGHLIATPITKIRIILDTSSIVDEGMSEFMQAINDISLPAEIKRVEVVVSYRVPKYCDIDNFDEVTEYIKKNKDDIFDVDQLHIINADTAITCLKLPLSFMADKDKNTSSMQTKKLIDQVAASFKNDDCYDDCIKESGEKLLSSGIFKKVPVEK